MTTSTLCALVVGTLIPPFTALFTRATAGAALKAVVTGFLAVGTGFVTTLIATPPVGQAQWQEFVGVSLVCWIASTAAYFGAWKPSGAATVIAERTAGFGLGPVAD